MKRHIRSGIMALWLAICCMVTVSAFSESRLMVVSDLHYLDPSLFPDRDLFVRALRGGDGKITQYGKELLSALYQEILAEQPDALIVTGDLTFNGEKKSHTALAEWFGTVEAAGVPVWVIPGNHDINTPSPLSFTSGNYQLTEPVTPEAFAEIYADFLMPGEAGFSYAAGISSDLWVVMTDVSWYQDQAQTFGAFTDGHAEWLEETLKRALCQDIRVVTATHHSLLPHTRFAQESFLMFGHEKMAALARRYGVKLNLSGHLHIQHIAQEDGLSDAALGAFCIWPHRFALVTLGDDGTLTYDAAALHDRFLPEGFQEMSREWFAGIARNKLTVSLPGTGEENALMADYAARFNLAYFSGTYRKEDAAWKADPAYALWKKNQDSSFWQYMELVMNEETGDNLHLECVLPQ